MLPREARRPRRAQISTPIRIRRENPAFVYVVVPVAVLVAVPTRRTYRGACRYFNSVVVQSVGTECRQTGWKEARPGQGQLREREIDHRRRQSAVAGGAGGREEPPSAPGSRAQRQREHHGRGLAGADLERGQVGVPAGRRVRDLRKRAAQYQGRSCSRPCRLSITLNRRNHAEIVVPCHDLLRPSDGLVSQS